METDHQPRLRLELAGIGGLAGLTLYVIVEHLEKLVSNDLLFLTICGFLYGLFASLLVLVGPVSIQRAIGWAAGIGVAGAALLFLSGLRFEEMDPYLDSVSPIAAFVTMIFLIIPFAMTRSERGRDWLHYPSVFDHAWTTFVRIFVSNLFMWLVFGLLWASAYLLTLVELDVLKDLLEEEWFAFTILGAVFGVSMAILQELSGIVVTIRRIILTLLRLLLPFVAVVTTLFIVLVPFRGLDEVFGSWSAAATILSMAVVAITLITASVDGRDEHAARVAMMVWSARLMSVVLPLMSGIAVYAIWLRIDEYGWTPQRMLASIGALIVLTYALAYCFGVLLRFQEWRPVIRKANIGVALGTIALCALWLSPVLNAERISSNNQLKRYLAGKTKPGDLGLWALEHEWGVAGRKVVAQLRTLSENEEHAALKTALVRLANSNSRWTFREANRNLAEGKQHKAYVATIAMALEPQMVPEDLFNSSGDYFLKNAAEACENKLPDGTAGCVLVSADLRTETSDEELVFIYTDGEKTVRRSIFHRPVDEGRYVSVTQDLVVIDGQSTESFFAALRAGDYELRPTVTNDLAVGGTVLKTKR